MSDPRYRPCDFAHEPEGFGKAGILRWKSDEELLAEHPEWRGKPKIAESRRKAAQMQHNYALRIRARMRKHDEPLNLSGYAELANEAAIIRVPRSPDSEPSKTNPADRLGKILRGAVIMRLEDIAIADAVLGQVSEFALAEAKAVAEQEERVSRELGRRP